MEPINEEELKARLDPLSYAVLREGATERPFTGEYNDTDKVGSYRCKVCQNVLFRCAKCDSHLGHVFSGEGYDVPTDERWCINSVAMYLEEKN